jgi:hypothetical protein
MAHHLGYPATWEKRPLQKNQIKKIQGPDLACLKIFWKPPKLLEEETSSSTIFNMDW